MTREFSIYGVKDFTAIEFVRAMKTQYGALDACLRENTFIDEDVIMLEEFWDTQKPFEFKDAIKEMNQERRRAIFSCIEPSDIFKNVESKLIDRQTVKKKRMFWDKDNKPYEKEFEDTYELYEIDALQIMPDISKNFSNNFNRNIYCSRCWCTTTNREYWIILNPTDIVSYDGEYKVDAIGAIATTIRIKHKNPKRLHRQGDVIIVELWGDDRDEQRHWRNMPLTKDQYLSLLYSET